MSLKESLRLGVVVVAGAAAAFALSAVAGAQPVTGPTGPTGHESDTYRLHEQGRRRS
jgi:hypothetical protein